MAAFESAGEEGLSRRLEGVSVAGREFVHAIGEGHTLNAIVGVQRDVFGETCMACSFNGEGCEGDAGV